jgi:hypothetical protein
VVNIGLEAKVVVLLDPSPFPLSIDIQFVPELTRIQDFDREIQSCQAAQIALQKTLLHTEPRHALTVSNQPTNLTRLF